MMDSNSARARWPLAVAVALILVACATLASRPAAAQLGIDVQASTLGIGGGLSWQLGPQFAVRLLGNGAPDINHTERAGDNTYRASLQLASAAALLDWHPGGSGFHITAGALYDGNKLEGDALPSANGTFTIGGLTVPAAQIGTLHGRVDFSKGAPYLGIGWAPPLRSTGLGFYADLGVAYQGKPDVTLTPELPPGSPLNNPIALALLQPAIAQEEARIENKIDGYRYYPVLSLGLTYRF